MICMKCGSEEVTVQGEAQCEEPLNFLVCTCRNCAVWWIVPNHPQYWQIIREKEKQ